MTFVCFLSFHYVLVYLLNFYYILVYLLNYEFVDVWFLSQLYLKLGPGFNSILVPPLGGLVRWIALQSCRFQRSRTPDKREDFKAKDDVTNDVKRSSNRLIYMHITGRTTGHFGHSKWTFLVDALPPSVYSFDCFKYTSF